MFKLLSALCLLIAAVPVSSSTEQHEMPGWMAGEWSRNDATGWADEAWLTPRAGNMLGVSRSGKGDTLQFWEQMRIVRENDGTLAFWAVAEDQKPVRFAAIEHSKQSILFANTTHDYPQHIRYWREGKVLHAEISLADGSRAIRFRFDRASSR